MRTRANLRIRDSLWKNNPASVQMLGLCPLLAVTTSAVNGIALGLATCVVTVASNGCISVLRSHIGHALRIPIFVMCIATLVTLLELFMQAYAYPLYQSLGIFFALITSNCVILSRVEQVAYHNCFIPSILDGLASGLGFLLVLTGLGGARELIGSGTFLQGADMLLGPWAGADGIHIAQYPGFLFALLPPGAFFGLAFLIAMKNAYEQRKT